MLCCVDDGETLSPVVKGTVPNGMVSFELRAAPLPDELVTFLEHEQFTTTDGESSAGRTKIGSHLLLGPRA